MKNNLFEFKIAENNNQYQKQQNIQSNYDEYEIHISPYFKFTEQLQMLIILSHNIYLVSHGFKEQSTLWESYNKQIKLEKLHRKFIDDAATIVEKQPKTDNFKYLEYFSEKEITNLTKIFEKIIQPNEIDNYSQYFSKNYEINVNFLYQNQHYQKERLNDFDYEFSQPQESIKKILMRIKRLKESPCSSSQEEIQVIINDQFRMKYFYVIYNYNKIYYLNSNYKVQPTLNDETELVIKCRWRATYDYNEVYYLKSNYKVQSILLNETKHELKHRWRCNQLNLNDKQQIINIPYFIETEWLKEVHQM